MKMDKVAGSKNDEFYTPKYAVIPILKKIPANVKIIWCPFDTNESYFVKELEKAGYKVIATHIKYNQDFFEIEPEKYDAIISNPPYSLKNEVFDRLFSLGKPFAMLVGVVGLFESQRRFEMFRNNEFEILYMNRRIDYFKNYQEKKPSKNPPFSSVYLTSGFLENKIEFEEIDKKII